MKRVIVTSFKDYLPPLIRIIGSLLGKIPSHQIKEKDVHFFKEFVKYSPEPTEIEFDPIKDLALLQYTGGTTGLPKGAMHTHYNLISNAYMCKAWTGAENGKDVYLNVIPFYHVFGMTVTMNTAVASASTMILIPRFDMIEVLRAQVGLSSPSIKDRIDKLEDEGVILGYRPVIDYRKLGLGLTAFVKVILEYPQCCSEDFATKLGELPEVIEGHFTDGDEDMLLKVVTKDPENLKDVLNEINAVEGIANTKTIISLTNPIREY